MFIIHSVSKCSLASVKAFKWNLIFTNAHLKYHLLFVFAKLCCCFIVFALWALKAIFLFDTLLYFRNNLGIN